MPWRRGGRRPHRDGPGRRAGRSRAVKSAAGRVARPAACRPTLGPASDRAGSRSRARAAAPRRIPATSTGTTTAGSRQARSERHRRRLLLRDSMIRTITPTRSSSVETSWSVDAGTQRRRPQSCLARLAGFRGAAAENSPSLVSTSSCSPVSASSITIRPGRAARIRAGSSTRIATTSCRCVSCSQRALPPGCADEVGDDEDEASAGGSRRRRRLEHGPTRSVVRPVRPGTRLGAGSRLRRSTWVRAAARRDDLARPRCRRTWPRPGCRPAREEPGQADGQLGQDELLRALDRRRSASTASGRGAARRSARGPR